MGIALCFVGNLFESVWFWAIWRALRNLDASVLRGERDHFIHAHPLDNSTARKIGFTHIYSWANMMQTRRKCVANMVNAVFTSLLHRACKCVSKYGIYHVCHTFAPGLHHICSWVNVRKSNFSCSVPNTAHAQTVDYLRVGRVMFCHAILITRIPDWSMFSYTTQHVVIVPERTSDCPGEKLSKHADNGGRDIRGMGYILVQWVSNNLVPVHDRQKSMDFKTLIETGRNCRN